MLPPLVRILLRNEMAAKSFHELVKQAYVSVALDEFGIGGRAATTSRIAILTGLTRKEVQALLGRPLDGEDRYGRNTIARPASLPQFIAAAVWGAVFSAGGALSERRAPIASASATRDVNPV